MVAVIVKADVSDEFEGMKVDLRMSIFMSFLILIIRVTIYAQKKGRTSE